MYDPTSATKRWLSLSETAEYLGVSEKSVRRYVARGDIKARRLPSSRLIRFDSRELDAALIAIPSAKAGA